MNTAFLKDFIRYKKYQYLVSKDKDNEKKILDNKNFNDHKNLLNSLKKNGYFLIPNFLPKNECSDLIKIIDKFIENYLITFGEMTLIRTIEFLEQKIYQSIPKKN